MKDESWAAEFAARVELACQDLVVGMALGDGGEDGVGFRTEFFSMHEFQQLLASDWAGAGWRRICLWRAWQKIWVWQAKKRD